MSGPWWRPDQSTLCRIDPPYSSLRHATLPLSPLSRFLHAVGRSSDARSGSRRGDACPSMHLQESGLSFGDLTLLSGVSCVYAGGLPIAVHLGRFAMHSCRIAVACLLAF